MLPMGTIDLKRRANAGSRMFTTIARLFVMCTGLAVCIALGASGAFAACGGDGQRACCGITGEGAPCNSGLIEVSGCSGDCYCGTFIGIPVYASGHCVAPAPCGGDDERACCVGESSGACQSGLTEVNGCPYGADDCVCSSGASSNSHCRQATHCGAEGERACCGGELIDSLRSCQSGLVELSGCTGDCFCGGSANPLGTPSSGHCFKPSHCGGDGERGCCIAASEHASGTEVGVCEAGKVPVFGCSGDCQCGGPAAIPEEESLETCITATHCGAENERACCESERFLNPCDSGLQEIPGCTGDCFCKGGTSSTTCVGLDHGKLKHISQPTTGRQTAPAEPRTCSLSGYADLHVHMFADTAHGGGVLAGASYDPTFDDVNVALRTDYGTHRDLVTKTGAEMPAADCPSWIFDCGEKRFHGGHQLSDDPVGTGTGDDTHSPLGAPNFTGWPTWHTTDHQQVYYKWLERAYQGGLRLISMLAVTNEALCLGNKHERGVNCADSMAAIDEQLQDAVAFESFIDAQNGGPGQGWFRIVRTPTEARRVIADGKLAVVLGIEVDNLFNCHWSNRNDTTGPCSPAGIRERVAHYYDLGVRHVFPIHNFNNAFGGPATWQDAIDVGNRASEHHWWSPVSEFNDAPGIVDCSPQGYGFKLSCVMQALVELLGFPPNIIPREDPIPCPDVAATCNTIGLTGRGRDLVTALMDKGMLIDIDHMSNRAISDTLSMAHTRHYPLVASHVQFFDLNKPSQRHERMRTLAQLQAIRDSGGMIAAMLKDDSQDSLFGKISKPNIPYTTSPSGAIIPDDCRHSTKTFAQMYQYAVDVMGGPVALGSDFNGIAGHVGPRFGPDGCGHATDEWVFEYRRGNKLQYPFDLASVIGPGFGTFGKQVTGGKTFDFNVDGLAHIGLLPDMLADLRLVGLPPEYFTKMFGSAEEYIRVWEKAAGVASGTPSADCSPATAVADATCHATASIAAAEDRSNPALTLTQNPPGPYGLGATSVTLTESSSLSCLTSTCRADVTVVDSTGPSMDCSTPAAAECAGATTPVSFAAPNLHDNCGTAVDDGCNPPSGSGFRLGDTTVTCLAHDAAQNSSSCTASVRVVDTRSPSVTCPAPQTIECQGSGHATASFTAGASDACAGTLAAPCFPASGSSFPVGTTPVDCSATDPSSNTGRCTSSVTVQDTQPPTIVCPPPSTLECTGNRGATGTLAATASDVCWGALAPTCSAGPSSFYPLGTTSASCSVTDGSHNPAQCGTSVTVRDTTAPSITCPPQQVLECTGNNGARGTVRATSSDVCWGALSPICSPAPNAFYPLGTTPASCSVADGSSNAAQCQTSVRVTDTARPQVTSSVTSDVIITPTGPNHNLLNVGLSATATDACNGARAVTAKVYANEDDETPTGDGVFSPDAASMAPGTLRLRYERIGSGRGRVYLIVSKATDLSGNVGASCSTVSIPISQSTSSINLVKQMASDARAACIAGNGTPPMGYVVVGDGVVIGTKQ